MIHGIFIIILAVLVFALLIQSENQKTTIDVNKTRIKRLERQADDLYNQMHRRQKS